MATRNHSTIGARTRSGHIKSALGIGLRTRPRLISVSPRYVFCLEYLSASRIASFFLYPLLYVCYNGVESGILSSTILEKLGVLLEFERYAVGYIV